MLNHFRHNNSNTHFLWRLIYCSWMKRRDFLKKKKKKRLIVVGLFTAGIFNSYCMQAVTLQCRQCKIKNCSVDTLSVGWMVLLATIKTYYSCYGPVRSSFVHLWLSLYGSLFKPSTNVCRTVLADQHWQSCKLSKQTFLWHSDQTANNAPLVH